MDNSLNHPAIMAVTIARAKEKRATREDVQTLLQSIKGRVDRLVNETAGTIQHTFAESLQDLIITLAMDNNRGADRSMLAVVASMLAAKAGVVAQDTYGTQAGVNAHLLADEARALFQVYAESTAL